MFVVSTIYLLIDYPPPLPSRQSAPHPLEHITIHHYGRKRQLVNLLLSFNEEKIGHISHVQLNIPPQILIKHNVFS